MHAGASKQQKAIEVGGENNSWASLAALLR